MRGGLRRWASYGKACRPSSSQCEWPAGKNYQWDRLLLLLGGVGILRKDITIAFTICTADMWTIYKDKKTTSREICADKCHCPANSQYWSRTELIVSLINFLLISRRELAHLLRTHTSPIILKTSRSRSKLDWRRTLRGVSKKKWAIIGGSESEDSLNTLASKGDSRVEKCLRSSLGLQHLYGYPNLDHSIVSSDPGALYPLASWWLVRFPYLRSISRGTRLFEGQLTDRL